MGGIVSTSGDVVVIPAPVDVRMDQLESDTDLFVFVESVGVLLPMDIAAEITMPGFYNQPGDLTAGVVPGGTIVNSYLLHGDNVDGSGVVPRLNGSISFDDPILAILLGNVLNDDPNPSLDDTDAILGSTTTLYGTGDFGRGLFFSEDSVILSADRRTVDVSFRFAAYYDQIRIVTIPEPASFLLLATVCPVILRRRTRNGEQPRSINMGKGV